MDELRDLFRRAEAPLQAIIEAVPTERWDAPSPCEGWTARDVVAHLIDAQRQFLSDRGFELPLAPSLAEPAAAWLEHLAAVEPLLADPGAMGLEYDGHFGRTTVGDTLLRFYVFDMVAHRWDIATAAGLETHFTDEELEQLDSGMDGFGAALYMPGVAKAGVEAPAGASREQRVLARLGRAA
jgi:uncharacterized protein (TIGR03086 family)